MRLLSRTATPLAAVMFTVALASASAAAPILDSSHIKATALDNGLRVIVKEEPSASVVSFSLSVRVGPLYETERTMGASHFVEHLLFEADSGRGLGKLGPFIEGVGGQINASTTRDATQVAVTVTPDTLEAVLPLLAKAAFEAKFTDTMVDDQRNVIKREIADRMLGSDEALSTALWGLAFTKHPYRFPIGGDSDSLAKLNTEALQAFYNEFYVPNNMAIIACGNVKFDAFVALCKQSFGQYFRKEISWTQPPADPPQTTPRIKVEPRSNDATLLAYAFRAPAITDKRDVCATDLIYALLGEGEDSLLRQKLEKEKQLVKGSSVDFITHRANGLLVITLVCDPRQELPARQALLGTVVSLSATKVTPEQLARAKKLIYVSYAFQNEACSDQVGSMGFYEMIDTYKFAVDYIDEVNRVTVDDIQRVAQTYLRPDAYSLVVMRSQKPAPGSEARLP